MNWSDAGHVRPLLLCVALVLLAGEVRGEGVSVEDEAWKKSAILPLDDPAGAPVVRAWARLVHSFGLGATSQWPDDVQELQKAHLDSGIPNLPVVSSTLILMVRQWLEGNQEGTLSAVWPLVSAAVQLSPDVPDYYFERSNLLIRHEPGRIGEALSDYMSGAIRAFQHEPTFRAMLLGNVVVLWAVGTLVMTVFTLFLLFRYLRLVGHDLSHVLRVRIPHWQSSLGAVLLLGLPFVLDLGLVVQVLVLWIALWLYMTRTERVTAAMLAVLLVVWPWADRAVRDAFRYPGSVRAMAYRCLTEDCGVAQRDTLASVLREGTPHPEEYRDTVLSLCAALVRDLGNPGLQPYQHRSWLYAREKESDGWLRVRLQILLANLEFAEGMRVQRMNPGSPQAGKDSLSTADVLYRQVLTMDPGAVEGWYNYSQLLRMTGHDDLARDALLAARDRDLQRVRLAEERSLMAESPNPLLFSASRELLIPGLIPEEAFSFSLKSGEGRLFAAHSVLLGPLGVRWCPLLAGLALAMVAILSAFQRRLKLSCRCDRCGSLRCISCWPEFSGTGLCHQCIYHKLRGSYVDPKEMWSREKRIDESRRARRHLAVVLTFLMPGVGHVLRGRALRGVIFLFGVLVPAGFLLLFPAVVGLVNSGLAATHQWTMVGIGLWLFVAVTSYVIAVLDILSER